MTYPRVMSEAATLELLIQGKSIARYGDGEFKLARGGSIKSQDKRPKLEARLRQILQDSGDCLVGIPNIHSQTPKAAFWTKYLSVADDLLADRDYVSSFISRADSAPWINTSAYWDRMADLWRGRDVTVVRGSGKSFSAQDLNELGAGTVTEIMCPAHNAFDEYDEILERIGTPERVLMSLGPTATVLAVDLCAKGVHAIDLGHAGAFHRRWRNAPEAA